MKKSFGTLPSGEETFLYTISCGKLSAAVTDYGATLVSLLVPDRGGVLADVVLGYDDCEGYRTGNGACLGATVGRNANRLKGASFDLNGKTYHMPANEGSNNLHSGPDFFFHRLWKLVSHTESAVTLELTSPNGDQGFPGNAVIQVTYALKADGALHILYKAACDQDTVFNFTNHSYFNLAGHDQTGRAMEQLLTIPGRFFNPDDAENIPTGELRPVAGTPMDFRAPKPIGQDIGADYEPLKLQGGYDHNWVIDRKTESGIEQVATVWEPASGRTIEVLSDQPGLQVYSGNFFDGKANGKYGKPLRYRESLALETQKYPDSPNHDNFPSTVLRPGEEYTQVCIYRFGVK